MPSKRPSTSFRLRPEVQEQLDALASWYGIGLTGAMELAVGCLFRAGPPAVPGREVIGEVLAELPEAAKKVTRRGRPRKAPLQDDASSSRA